MTALPAPLWAQPASAPARPAHPAALGVERLSLSPEAELPLFTSGPMDQAHPEVQQVLIALHGHERDAKHYFDIARAAVKALPPEVASRTFVMAPQFPNAGDVAARGAPAATLRWAHGAWESGGESTGPKAITSFAVLDALLRQIADPQRFPAVRRVVIAGHSGGAQLAQRYAVARSVDGVPGMPQVALRYVVANPSSYTWFGSQRPRMEVVQNCPSHDQWKYGLQRRPAPLDRLPAPLLESSYARLDVVYLLGGADIDPEHPALDKSCAAEAQGRTRLERGQAFVAALRERNGASTQHMALVPGVGHDARRMFLSTCGLAALWDSPGCPALGQP